MGVSGVSGVWGLGSQELVHLASNALACGVVSGVDKERCDFKGLGVYGLTV